MQAVWGVVVVAMSLLCWGGQIVSWLAPATAAKLNLAEAESEVEPAYWADIRGEAAWDVVTLWTLVVAGVLLIIDHSAWPPFGLVGGAMYVYFAGRGILTRLVMRRRGLRVGTLLNLKLGITLLTLWGVVGLITIIAAAGALQAS